MAGSRRFRNFISQNGASGLTTVPRDALFPRAPVLDLFLLDKSAVVWLLAFFGAILMTVRHGVAGAAVTAIWLTPWPFLTT